MIGRYGIVKVRERREAVSLRSLVATGESTVIPSPLVISRQLTTSLLKVLATTVRNDDRARAKMGYPCKRDRREATRVCREGDLDNPISRPSLARCRGE